jgi:hypothetical protein
MYYIVVITHSEWTRTQQTNSAGVTYKQSRFLERSFITELLSN